jgi:hypothetical protein
VTRRLSHRRIALGTFALIFALVAEASVADARMNTRAASLEVSAPASMARGSVLAVKAKGYSGQYNTVSWSSVHGSSSPCAPPNVDTITMQTVPRNHAFDVNLTNVVGAPGTLTVCVYLFTSGPHANDAKGHYVVKSKPVKVS